MSRGINQCQTKVDLIHVSYLCMFLSHSEDCGLEEAVSLATQPINDSLIHAIVERWNPRTNTFWFLWGEMTITLDEFSSIMGLPEPKVTQEDQLKTNSLATKVVDIRFMVKTRGKQRRMIEIKLEQTFMGDKEEESSSETPPKMEENDQEYEEYRKFQRYMIMFNKKQAQTERAKKK
ncbi:hypothetical protein EJ110_NYTH35284 [Nymphaea thermarum]|nr:hypothetical protein EJ110_NYTH35284 [Nymphaea thermarum]